MPEFKDCKGKSVMIEEWPGNSYKAKVINRAYRENKFWAVDMLGTKQTFFKCEWCKRWITSAGVQGDHVVQQKMGKSQSPEVRGLAEMLKGDRDELALSCAECNQGTRNEKGMHTRGGFAQAREKQEWKEVTMDLD